MHMNGEPQGPASAENAAIARFVVALVALVLGVVSVAFYANGHRSVAACLAVMAILGVGYYRRGRTQASKYRAKRRT